MLIDGKSWTRAELLQRVGSISQLGGITPFEYTAGKAKGVRGLRVRTAAGLDFCVVPDRGMDIIETSYQGRSLCYLAPVGVVHPAYYDARDTKWLNSFSGGLLATCGLTNTGFPSVDEGEVLGLHGSISNTPAEEFHWYEEWGDDDLLLTIKGKVREARIFGPNLVLNRTIQTSLSGRSFKLHDVVVNEGYQESPFMLFYHLNFGFPLLTEHSRIYSPSLVVEGRNECAGSSVAEWNRFNEPVAGIAERVYYHSMQPDPEGNVSVVLVSDERDPKFGIQITYSQLNLPQFVEWKMTGESLFVLGLEPTNSRCEGRKIERETGRLQFLAPGEEKELGFHLQVLEGHAEVSAAISQLNLDVLPPTVLKEYSK